VKIDYQGTVKANRFSDYFNAGIHRSHFEGDEFDYLMFVTIFGREWSWYIHK
jgi:hypothetical protein